MTTFRPRVARVAQHGHLLRPFPSGWNASPSWQQFWPPASPKRPPELFAYQASIIRAKRNYEVKQWVAYDRQFGREALARKDLNWSVPNLRLYNEAFTGRGRISGAHDCSVVVLQAERAPCYSLCSLGTHQCGHPRQQSTHPGHLQEL